MLGLLITLVVLNSLSMLFLASCVSHLQAIRKAVEATVIPNYPPRG